ncbi:MAG TPA: bifunctional phosphopantothenoylcysteine decarboxylase/phosphopantothenate--cysteine ligase CoaBC [Thermoplasmata archaeon]|nr:bifunctional phosphopantothenoylcysteine decarboxylase/phosphopantothenate--cysteine ligase CoaBC [Thermoplasmata archaeon]
MHPSRAIRGRTTRLLEGRRIVLGITGSIAAVEVPKIARELIRHGAEVRAVMSPDAARIITPEAVEFATGHPPVLQLSGNVEHVTLLGPGEGRADLYLIAPATANTLSKIAHGIDDTAVTSCASVALGGKVPILLAPAMHSLMGENPAVRESREKLERWGVSFLYGPRTEGEEKVAAPEEVAAAVIHRLADGPWRGRRIVVIGGAARESIDAVRSVTNESSGATAVAWANQAYYRGADVELWAGALSVPVPSWIPVRPWRGVGDLLALARRRRSELSRASAIAVPAALSDFTLLATPGKIASRERRTLTLQLTRAPKVLPELRKLAAEPTRLVAFKLLADATDSVLEEEGRRLQAESGADWVVANDARTMGAAEAAVMVLPRGEGRRWVRGPKAEVAGKLLDDLGRELSDIVAPGAPPRGTKRPRGGAGRRRGPR